MLKNPAPMHDSINVDEMIAVKVITVPLLVQLINDMLVSGVSAPE